MNITAKLNYLRIAPRKVRLVADLLRGKSFLEAERILLFMSKRSAAPILKLLRSAAANARHNFQINEPSKLWISAIRVDSGPTIKRHRPRAFGRAFPIRGRTSHVSIILETASAPKSKPPRSQKPSYRLKQADVVAGRGVTAEHKPQPEREVFRGRPKISTKPTDFVRRMFRRKAI